MFHLVRVRALKCLRFSEDNEKSISPLTPLKTSNKYLPLRLFGLPYTFEDEEAIEIKRKNGTVSDKKDCYLL